MAGTNIVAARKALIAALQGMTGQGAPLGNAVVDYSYVGKHHDGTREYIFGGSSDGSTSLSAMQGGGRVKREETPDWTLSIYITTPGESTTEVADERAVELGVVVEDYLAANMQLDGTVTGLLKAIVTGWSLTSWPDDSGCSAVLAYNLQFHSYLT